jgi:multiple sugar transport system permease protein
MKKVLEKLDSLKITAVVITLASCVLLLFPLVYMLTNSMKDNMQIYETPPKFLPSIPKTISIAVDYSEFKGKDRNEILDTALRDSTLSMYAVNHELNKDGIFEIKVYGILDNKTIFYSRVNKMRLQMNLDYGVYKGMTVREDLLLTNEKYTKSAEEIGYEFNLEGLDRKIDLSQADKNYTNDLMKKYLSENFKIKGRFIGTRLGNNAGIFFENFKYYFETPKMMYKNEPLIAKYSFLIFIANTVIVISWAILTQVFLCSITAYPLSRLFSKKISSIIMLYFLGTLMVPFVVIMIPQLLMFRKMGMYDNYAALLVPYLLPYGFYIFLFKGFFDRLPNELFEAARLDGASEFYVYRKICMPLSKPIISLIALQTFLSNLQDFMWAYMVIEKPRLWTLNVALYNLSKNTAVKENFMMGMSLVTILPAIILTIIFAKQIKESVANAGLKG